MYYQKAFTPPPLNAPEDKSHSHFKEKPLWGIIDPKRRIFIREELEAMMRMSWQSIYFYQDNKSQAVKPEGLSPVEVNASPTQSGEVSLMLVDFHILHRTQDWGYIIPVLSKEQRLSLCVGGIVSSD